MGMERLGGFVSSTARSRGGGYGDQLSGPARGREQKLVPARNRDLTLDPARSRVWVEATSSGLAQGKGQTTGPVRHRDR